MLSTEMKERNRGLQASLASPSLTSLQVSACLTLPLGSQGKGHPNGSSVSEREKEGILNDLRLLSERRSENQPESHDKVTCCSNGGGSHRAFSDNIDFVFRLVRMSGQVKANSCFCWEPQGVYRRRKATKQPSLRRGPRAISTSAVAASHHKRSRRRHPCPRKSPPLSSLLPMQTELSSKTR